METKLQIQLIYGIPSILLYFIIFWTLIANRKKIFNSAFWYLFFNLGIVECLAWLITYALFRFPNAGVFLDIYSKWPKNNFLAGKLMFCGYYIHITQLMANTMISANRFTAIVLSNRHDNIWQRAIVWAIALTFLVPLLFTWQILTRVGTWWSPDEASYYLTVDGGVKYVITGSEISVGYLSCLAGIVLAITGLIFNGSAVVSLLFRRLGSKQAPSNTTTAEIKLFFMGLLMFFSQLLLVVYDVLIEAFTPDEFLDAFLITYDQLGWLVDLSCLTSPWMILIASRALRVELLKTLCGGLFKAYGNAVGDGTNQTRSMHNSNSSMIRRQNLAKQAARA